MLSTTDYRPSKALYVNVNNNNLYRMYLQQNAAMIRENNLRQFTESMGCNCERLPVVPPSSVRLFNNSFY